MTTQTTEQNASQKAGIDGTMEYPPKTTVASFCEAAVKRKSHYLGSFWLPFPMKGISAKET